MSAWGAAIGAASSIGGFGLGFIGMKRREKRNDARQRALMDHQQKGQMALNEHGQKLGIDTWKKTGVVGQMEQMQKAGVNPGLMYGQGGAGGATTNSGSGGSQAGGQAMEQRHMDVNVSQGLQVGANLALLKAQKENIEADTQLKREQAPESRERGIKGYLENAETRNMRSAPTDEKITSDRSAHYDQEGTIHSGSKTDSLNQSTVIRADEEWKNMEASRQKMISEEVLTRVNSELSRSKKVLTDEQSRKVQHDIIVNYINAGLKGLDTIVKGRLGSIGSSKGSKGYSQKETYDKGGNVRSNTQSHWEK